MTDFGHVGRTKSPCYGCKDRTAECHASCGKYKEFERIHDRERSEVHQKKHLESLGYGAPYRTSRQLQNLQHGGNTFSIIRNQKKGG